MTYLYGANVHANGIRQHYLRYGGRGAPLVLVPGITSPAITWGFVAEELARDFDVYVLDVRGRGLSEAPQSKDYSLDAYAADVLGLVDALKLGDHVLVGHSMGARIAIRVGRSNPRGLTKLILLDPPVSGPGRRPYPITLDFYIESLKAARHGLDFEAVRASMPGWSEQHLRLRAEWLHTCNEDAIVKTHEGFHNEDIHVDLPHLRAPTLLMVATRGGVIGPSDIEEIKGLAPQIAIEPIADAGHMIPWDKFDESIAAIRRFCGVS